MLVCEGYRMFRGTMRFLARLPGAPDMFFHGTWLYKPENNMWYVNNCPDYPYGTSLHAERCRIEEDEG